MTEAILELVIDRPGSSLDDGDIKDWQDDDDEISDDANFRWDWLKMMKWVMMLTF